MSRVAVVTGGASGLGHAICTGLSNDGHRVAVLDIDAEAAENTAAQLQANGTAAVAVGVDVSDEHAVQAAFDTVRTQLGAVEILVTSAAIAGFTRLLPPLPANSSTRARTSVRACSRRPCPFSVFTGIRPSLR